MIENGKIDSKFCTLNGQMRELGCSPEMPDEERLDVAEKPSTCIGHPNTAPIVSNRFKKINSKNGDDSQNNK